MTAPIRTGRSRRRRRAQAVAHSTKDASYPERPIEALLVREGDAGEVVQVGRHSDTDTPVYLVEFGERLVVGCFEEELIVLD
jgi:nitrogen fixation protein NifZ